MDTILIVSLLLSNLALFYVIVRLVKMKRKIASQRAKIRVVRQIAKDEIAGQMPNLDRTMLGGIGHSSLAPLLRRSANGRSVQADVPDLLPAPDQLPEIDALIPDHELPEWADDVGRRDMQWQSDKLRFHFRGRPELIYWNALAISYLRRRTLHTEKAKAVFHRIWDEHGDELIEHLNLRWKRSTLLTFFDHPLSSEQKIIGATGWFYGSLLNIHEIERRLERRPKKSRYDRAKVSLENEQGQQFGTQDVYVNINTKACEIALAEKAAGTVLIAMLEEFQARPNVFTRFDENRIFYNKHANSPANWSFGRKPE